MEMPPSRSSGTPIYVYAVVAFVFCIGFVPLDAATRFIQSPQGVVPWYPPAALTVVLLVVFGLRYAPVALLTVAACNYLIWDLPRGSFGLGPLLLAAISVALYSGAAAWLRHSVLLRADLVRLRDAAWFVVGVIPASTLSGFAYATYLFGNGSITRNLYASTARDFALGDLIGIFTFAPVLLLIVQPLAYKRSESTGATGRTRSRLTVTDLGWTRRQALEFAAWFVLLLMLLWTALVDRGGPSGSRLYLTFVPLIWAALRTGVRGSSAAVLFISCLTVGAAVYEGYRANIAELQLYLLALSLTGLSLGAAVTEHKKAHEMWRRYEFMANALGEQMALIDRDFRYEAVNDAFCQVHGRDRGAVIGYSVAEIWGADAYQYTIRDYLSRSFAGSSETTEGWYKTAAGRRYYRLEYTPYVEAEKRITHCVMVAHDVTEKQLAHRAQEKTENLYRRAIAASDAVPYVRDYSGGRDEFLFMGPEIERMTGYSSSELTTAVWESIQQEVVTFGEVGGLSYGEAVSRTRSGEFKYWRSDNRIRAKDGSIRWITDASVEIQDDEGEVVGSIGMLSDITERKRAEEALRESEERFELALLGADLGLWDWDMTNDRLTVNERFAEMLGFAPDDAIAAGYMMRTRIHPEDRDAALEAMRQHIDGKTPNYEAEYRVRHLSGKYIWVLNRGRIFERDENGVPLRALGTHLDITHRHAVEEDRRKLESRILHAQKSESLGILAGGIAHDFNNLLVGILGNADLALLERQADASDREHLEAIVTSAQRAAELCRQMLAYSGKGHFVVQPIDLNDVVREMAHLLSVSVSKRVTLHYDFASELPAVEVDVTQMRQIVMNLITNASEAIGDAEGSIGIRTVSQFYDQNALAENYLGEILASGTYVVLEITDTGCGMDRDTLARMFDPFFTTKFTGRGLGMAAVLGIIRGHRGAIDVRSAVGEGTSFTVLLPASTKAPRSQPSAGTEEAEWRGSGTVLVVEDEPHVLDLVVKLLTRAGFSALPCADGTEAVQAFQRNAEDVRLVLLDMTTPGTPTPDAIRAIREVRQNVPIILTSGYSKSDDVQQFENDGIACFLQKPYRATTLYEAVRKAIGR